MRQTAQLITHLALQLPSAFYDFAQELSKATSTGSEPNFAQAMLRPHMVLVYTISNKIHAILHIKVDFGPFCGCFLQFLKKNSRNLPILCARFEELPQLRGVCFMTFIHILNHWAIITILAHFRGVFLQFLKKNSRNLPILCACFEELPQLKGVCFMTFMHISNRWAIIIILGHFGDVFCNF